MRINVVDELLRKARNNWVSVLFWIAYYTEDSNCNNMDRAEEAQIAEIFESFPYLARECDPPVELRGNITDLNFLNINPQLEGQSRTIHKN